MRKKPTILLVAFASVLVILVSLYYLLATDDASETSLSEEETNEDSTNNREAGEDSENMSSTELAEPFAKTPEIGNPLISHKFGADPNSLVYDGRVYLFMTSDDFQYDQDGNVIDNTYEYIDTLTVISSEDLINWSDHGEIPVAGPNGAATWATQSWAPSIVSKTIDGEDTFFLYFANNASNIGVLSADHPLGPWTDPTGEPIVSSSTPGTDGVVWMFDPGVFVDDDNTAYMYFGGGVPGGDNPSQEQAENPKTARVIQLSDDMISTVGEAEVINAPFMFEAAEMHKYNEQYYFTYSTNFSGQRGSNMPGQGEIGYMISEDPMGPFTYSGVILSNPYQFFGVGGNNHHDIFEFHDQWYITYHAQTLAQAFGKENGYRSPHINKLQHLEDGQIEPITADRDGVSAVKHLNPYERTEAETFAWNAGISTEESGAPGNMVENINLHLTDINPGDWIAVANADFGESGAEAFQANIASTVGGEIEIRLDDKEGEVIGTLDVTPTGGVGEWELMSTSVDRVTGVHDVYFVFHGEVEDNLFNFDYWQFTTKE